MQLVYYRRVIDDTALDKVGVDTLQRDGHTASTAGDDGIANALQNRIGDDALPKVEWCLVLIRAERANVDGRVPGNDVAPRAVSAFSD